jgi:1-aminocyclopropane-1-carboxylate deaminase
MAIFSELRDLLSYDSTPVQEIVRHPAVVKAGVRLLIKREDLNHPSVSGNKWWKLKYNLEAAAKEEHRTILTFGGAYSNHIYATAAAAASLGLKTIGIIRGEQTDPLNSTLVFAQEQGMQIHYVSRTEYKTKTSEGFMENLRSRFGKFYLIPEGGSNRLAVKGCAEFAVEKLSKLDFDHLLLPVGTGGTMAGIVSGLDRSKNIIGVPVLKGGDFLNRDILKMIEAHSGTSLKNWKLWTAYHGGGYAKMTSSLISFIQEMKTAYDVPLDPVYTGKLFWAVLKEVEAGSFKRGSTILVLHTGGLQGASSLNKTT